MKAAPAISMPAMLIAMLGVPETASAQADAQPDPEVRTVREQAGRTTESLDERFQHVVGRPGGLTAEQVGRRAARTSPNADVEEKQIAIAAARVDEAIVTLVPRLTLTARYTRYSPINNPTFGPGDQGSLVIDPAGTTGPIPPGAPFVGAPLSAFSFPVLLNQYWFQAGLTVPVSDYFFRGKAGIQAAKRGKNAARLRADAARLAAATNAKLAYYDWVRARLQQVVAEQTLEQSRAQLTVVRRFLEAGRLSRTDLLQAEAQLARTELLLERAAHLTDLTEDQVRTLMHDESDEKYSIGETIGGAAGTGVSRPSFDEAYDEALRKRIEIRAVDERVASLKEQTTINRAEGYPKLELFGNLYYVNPNPRIVPQQNEFTMTWDAGVQLVWSPNDLGTSSMQTRQLEANVAQARAEKQQLRDQVRAEVMGALQAWREADLALATSQRGLKAAEEAYRSRRQLFEAGRASPLEVVDSQTELLRAKLEVINARVGLEAAEIRFEHAVGRDARASR